MRVETRVPNMDENGDHWTEGALTGLIGQTPKVTVGGNFEQTVGTATVVAVRRDGNDAILTLDLKEDPKDPSRLARVKETLGFSVAAVPNVGFGYYVDQSHFETMEDKRERTRRIEQARLMTVYRAGLPPATPQ